ncbi:MAG: hypothetical protein Q9191_005095, partial [Dirinaria sp. TL-2023a]
MYRPSLFYYFSALFFLIGAQSGSLTELTTYCHPNSTSVVCITRHAAVLPPPFNRQTSRDGDIDFSDSFQDTSVPSDPSFSNAKNASFLVFNQTLGLSLLGPNPSNKQLFPLSPNVHEAPVYIPSQNRIIFSEFGYGVVSQLQLNLNTTPPLLSPYTPQTVVQEVNGGVLHDGLIYWAASGSKSLFLNGTTINGLAPGIYSVDPLSGEVNTVVNNYYGTALNSPNDLTFDSSTGDLFFTDSIYGYE